MPKKPDGTLYSNVPSKMKSKVKTPLDMFQMAIFTIADINDQPPGEKIKLLPKQKMLMKALFNKLSPQEQEQAMKMVTPQQESTPQNAPVDFNL